MKYWVVTLLIYATLSGFAKDEKNDRKVKAAIDKEELRFRRNEEKTPGDAEIYWEHANNLLAFNTEFSRAQAFYKKALEIDSVNAEIYRDYGKYLFEKLAAFDDAKIILTRGLQLSPADEQLKEYLATTEAAIARRNEEQALYSFGHTNIKELNAAGSYPGISDFDSLKKVVADNGDKSYRRLLKRFMADDKSLTAADMYLMMIGYSGEADYSPFNYNEILTMKQVARINLDSGINRGLDLVNINPLNPSLNRELMYYYRKKGDTVAANRYRDRVCLFFDGMLYSGNGTCERPYLSLWSKEYSSFASYIGYKLTENHSMGSCGGQMVEFADMVNLATAKTESICFNLKLVYQQTTRR